MKCWKLRGPLTDKLRLNKRRKKQRCDLNLLRFILCQEEGIRKRGPLYRFHLLPLFCLWKFSKRHVNTLGFLSEFSWLVSIKYSNVFIFLDKGLSSIQMLSSSYARSSLKTVNVAASFITFSHFTTHRSQHIAYSI